MDLSALAVRPCFVFCSCPHEEEELGETLKLQDSRASLPTGADVPWAEVRVFPKVSASQSHRQLPCRRLPKGKVTLWAPVQAASSVDRTLTTRPGPARIDEWTEAVTEGSHSTL